MGGACTLASMHVALLTHAFPPAKGGVETFVYTLAHALVQEHGFTVTVITFTPETLPNEDSLPFRVVRAPDTPILRRYLRAADVILENSAFLKLIPELLLSRRPRVRVLHDRQNLAAQRASTRTRRWAARRVVDARRWWTRAAAQVVAVSADVAHGAGVPHAVVIHNGYDDTVFTREISPTDRDPYSLIAVCRLQKEKGTDLAVRAVRALRDRGIPAHLTVVGDGPELTHLKALAASIRVDTCVRFTGSLDASNVNRELNSHSIFVLPSVWDEPFGIAILEAQGAGCAVVASNIGGIPEAVGGKGVLFTPGDVEAFIESIADLMNDPARRLELIPPLSHMRGRSVTAMSERYARILSSAARPSRGAVARR